MIEPERAAQGTVLIIAIIIFLCVFVGLAITLHTPFSNYRSYDHNCLDRFAELYCLENGCVVGGVYYSVLTFDIRENLRETSAHEIKFLPRELEVCKK